MNQNLLNFLKFISFRMDCLREQQENPMKLDMEACQAHIDELEALKGPKVEELIKTMPQRPVMKTQDKPKNPYKKDGTFSEHGKKWFALLREQGLPKDTVGPVKHITGWVEGNPNSPEQVKEWLFSLGWKPQTFKYDRNKLTGEERAIPQVRKEGLLCDSVLDLADNDPAIEMLDGITVISHRLGILNGFMKAQEDGWVVSGAGGFTNTLRFKHRAPVVNLPSVEAKYGDYCRGVLTPPEGKVMVGSDVTSLEDSLKQHYIFPHDPEYVDSMSDPNYDPHVSLGIDAGKVTQEEYDFYTSGTGVGTEEHKRIHKIRKPMKTVNYACQYIVGAKTLSRQSGMTMAESSTLIDVYWKKNWAVKEVAKEQYVKTLRDGTMWLKNPINGFYYSLRYEKDIFSTLVQGSGDYLFNLWTLHCRKMGIKLHLNYHDEWLTSCLPEEVPEYEAIAQKAMDRVNETLKLNKVITMDVQTGASYAECH